MKLEGKVAIVTGGGRGIGHAIAGRLAAEGARLCLCARQRGPLDATAAELAGGGATVLAVAADVTREDTVEEMVGRVLARFGTIDILVNNSGVAGPTAPLHDIGGAAWREVIDTNLNGLFYCTKHVVPTMIEKRSGAILNIGSIGGVSAYPLRSPYNASKCAVAGVTQTIAAEVGPFNVRCNCLSPGPVEGERFWKVMKAKAEATGKTFEETKAWWEEQVPLRRFVTEEEVARAALFLVSDDASGITGQQLCVSGGMEIL